MNYEMILALIALVIGSTFAGRVLRHEFIVSQGFAGLLYKHGKFAELLASGRHIRWGRGFTLAPLDIRKATLAVAGQEVLTADNNGRANAVAPNSAAGEPES
jgi:hypothetical protein